MRLATVLCLAAWFMLWAPLSSAHQLLSQDLKPVNFNLPDPYVLTNNTILSILRHIVTSDNQVIFTTVSFPKAEDGTGPSMKMLNNFAFWLDKADALKHAMIITTDERTFRILRAAGYPAYLDRAFPIPARFPPGEVTHQSSPNAVYHLNKWWWAWAITSHGVRCMFMDSSTIVMKSPWSLFNAAEYDMQGLSDWLVPELPKPGDPLEKPCDLYWMVPWETSPLKYMVFSKWDLPLGNDTLKLLMYTPCQSTGLWTVEPTVAAVSALRHMNARLANSTTLTQWEQAMWNELVMTHLWGSDVEPPLRYRLLPHDAAASVKVWQARRAEGLPADLVVLRAGYLDGMRKEETYARLGFWHPDYSRREEPLLFPSQATLLRAPSQGTRGVQVEVSWQNLAVSVVPAVQSLNAEVFILLGGLAVVAVIYIALLQRRGRRASSA